MTPQSNARLQELLPAIAKLEAYGEELARLEEQVRRAEAALVPWARQVDRAEDQIRGLRGFRWRHLVATVSRTKAELLRSASDRKAAAAEAIQAHQEELNRLRNEVKLQEGMLDPLKSVREEYERLLRQKESWLRYRPDTREQVLALNKEEADCYRTFITLDSLLIAVHGVESVFADLLHTLHEDRNGKLGPVAVPLLKNLRKLLTDCGARYMDVITLVDRAYAFAAQSTALMLREEAMGVQILEEVHAFSRRAAQDFVADRGAWRAAQRRRIEYVAGAAIPPDSSHPATSASGEPVR